MTEEKFTNYIVDSSFVLAHLMPDEGSKEIDIIFENHAQGRVNLYASPILPYEVANGFRSAVLTKRIDAPHAQTLLNDFLGLSISFLDIELQETLSLSLDKNCSLYDAPYLYLSKKHKLPLLTLDTKLQKAI